MIDAPCFARPVKIVWRKRTWRCVEPACPVGTFTEQNHTVAEPRALLTVRACWWVIRPLRREHASVRGIARQLGTTWNTVWTSIRPLPKAMAKEATSDPFRGYKNATDDKLEDATAVLDAFHVVMLGSAAVDEVRRRVQQQIRGHRGRKGDLLYGHPHHLALRGRENHRPTTSATRPRDRR
ncbi:transposase [Actinacidiphila sp. bgisy144]|uniref:transposase n=1 Tax=Actinacidiphila sp. bgisy144 TaxID=3413791 RepID=UPI003EBBDEFD